MKKENGGWGVYTARELLVFYGKCVACLVVSMALMVSTAILFQPSLCDPVHGALGSYHLHTTEQHICRISKFFLSASVTASASFSSSLFSGGCPGIIPPQDTQIVNHYHYITSSPSQQLVFSLVAGSQVSWVLNSSSAADSLVVLDRMNALKYHHHLPYESVPHVSIINNNNALVGNMTAESSGIYTWLLLSSSSVVNWEFAIKRAQYDVVSNPSKAACNHTTTASSSVCHFSVIPGDCIVTVAGEQQQQGGENEWMDVKYVLDFPVAMKVAVLSSLTVLFAALLASLAWAPKVIAVVKTKLQTPSQEASTSSTQERVRLINDTDDHPTDPQDSPTNTQ